MRNPAKRAESRQPRPTRGLTRAVRACISKGSASGVDMSAGFAVAAGSRLAAESAAEALRAGGSAVDGAIAGALAACVAEPVLASPFGGGFLMVREAGGRTRLLDFFVQTPARKRPVGESDLREVRADFGRATQAFLIGAGTIACPGVAAGLAEAHARFGRAPFADLAAPAVAAARRGVALDSFQAHVMRIVAPICLADAHVRAALCGGGETIPEPGALLRNPDLADMIEVFAHEGARFMQEGEPAAALASLCASGGHLAASDMRAYAPHWRTPLTVLRNDARISLNPPPATGGALIAFALALIGQDAGSATLARAFAATARARIEANLESEPDIWAARLADPELIGRYRREVLGRFGVSRGTTHVSTVDASGMGAALTLSNGSGSGLIVPGTGAMPNNMLGESDLVAEPGAWRTDSRLASMMSPTAVEWPDGRCAMLGSGGSNRIRTALTQVLRHIVDSGLRLEDAVTRPRLHVEGGREGGLDFEDAFAEEDRVALLAAWPEARPWPEPSMFFGGVHAVARGARGDIEAAGDPRRAGMSLTG